MEMLYAGRFLNLVREGRWEYCERVRRTSAAMIFTLTDRREIVLVEEFRPAISRQSICFPAGLIGDEGDEDAETAARRELMEETGFEAKKMLLLYEGPSSPGITSEYLSFFLAVGLHRVGDGGGVQGERITVHCLSFDRADAWLAQQRASGKAVDPRIYAGLYEISKYLGANIA